jgi:hypothetical protein
MRLARRAIQIFRMGRLTGQRAIIRRDQLVVGEKSPLHSEPPRPRQTKRNKKQLSVEDRNAARYSRPFFPQKNLCRVRRKEIQRETGRLDPFILFKIASPFCSTFSPQTHTTPVPIPSGSPASMSHLRSPQSAIGALPKSSCFPFQS